MHLSRRIAALLAAVLVAGAPAVAHAQGSAGDEQYQDPFGGATNGDQGGSGGGQKDSGSGSSGQSGSSGSSGAQSAPAPAAPAPAPATSSSTPSPSSGATSATPVPAPAPSSTGARQELPRTGLDAPVIALLGIGLLAAGIGLRLRLRAVDGRR